MLLNIQPYSQNYTQNFQAKSPEGLSKSLMQNKAVDKFVGKELAGVKEKKYSFKDMFFEIFPQLDSSYRKIFNPLKKADSKVKIYNSDKDVYRKTQHKSYIDYDTFDYGIDNTGYGFGRIENDGLSL